MSNARFAVSLHILTLLKRFEGEVLSSAFIAGSININPATVRKEIGNLKKQGLVTSKEGKEGGTILAKPAQAILLSEIYRAVKQTPLLGKNKNEPNPLCDVGRQINHHLDDLYKDVEEYLERRLEKLTLADFVRKFD
ncbi:Rrf2 family transcriptional regulator [Negadavirga shengliensis]|uniref:Rrf2 family transcriptional regulator n=1 Tax=Negadavirga shengliensis TaxID=1389218 RepID=A0ABV9TAG9_9BACT